MAVTSILPLLVTAASSFYHAIVSRLLLQEGSADPGRHWQVVEGTHSPGGEQVR